MFIWVCAVTRDQTVNEQQLGQFCLMLPGQ